MYNNTNKGGHEEALCGIFAQKFCEHFVKINQILLEVGFLDKNGLSDLCRLKSESCWSVREQKRGIMEKRRTWKEYRAIDLGLLAAALAIFEFIIVRAANWWFPGQPYTVSLAAAVTSIVYMRWGAWGMLHAAEAGAVFCFFSGGGGEQYLIYCAGNLLSAFVPLLMKAAGKEKARTGGLGLAFAALTLLLMQAGRAAAAIALGAAPAAAAGFFTTDSLSYVFTLVIIWIAQKLDGVYEDQKHYLLRLHAEEERKKEVNL